LVGTITYDVTNNVVTAVGGTAQTPIGFVDLWNADKTGILSLHARTGIATVDGANVALTRNARPTDRVVLGGAKQDLYIVVTAWTNMTSATVQLIGTDSAGNAQTEDLTITGNATIYAAKYFATLTHSKVTTWVGTGSFAYELMQTQWGVVWRQTGNQYAFDGFIQIGDGTTQTYFADTNKQVVFSNGIKTTTSQKCITVQRYVTFTLGVLQDASTKRTGFGCQISDLEATYYGHIIYPVADSATIQILLYGCTFQSPIVESWWQATQAYNINCNGGAYPHISVYNTVPQEYNNIIVSGARTGGSGYGIRRPRATTTLNNLFIMVPSTKIWFQSSAGTAKNVYFRGGGYTVRMESVNSDCYIINADDGGISWSMNWVSSTGKVFRQYEFDLSTEPGATVELFDYNGDTALYQLNGSTWEPVDSVTADENGVIPTKNFRLQYYDQAHGNVPVCSGPFWLRISKPGYQTYEKLLDIPVDSVTGYYNPKSTFRLQVKLSKAQPVLSGLGQPIVNLNAGDPENMLVLPL